MKKFLIITLLMAFLLAGCALAEPSFYEGFTASQLVIGLVTILITITQSLFPKISIIQLIKQKFMIEDRAAFLLVMVFFFGLSALAEWVTGYFVPGTIWNLQKVIAFYGILLTTSQAAYQQLKASGRTLMP